MKAGPTSTPVARSGSLAKIPRFLDDATIQKWFPLPEREDFEGQDVNGRNAEASSPVLGVTKPGISDDLRHRFSCFNEIPFDLLINGATLSVSEENSLIILNILDSDEYLVIRVQAQTKPIPDPRFDRASKTFNVLSDVEKRLAKLLTKYDLLGEKLSHVITNETYPPYSLLSVNLMNPNTTLEIDGVLVAAETSLNRRQEIVPDDVIDQLQTYSKNATYLKNQAKLTLKQIQESRKNNSGDEFQDVKEVDGSSYEGLEAVNLQVNNIGIHSVDQIMDDIYWKNSNEEITGHKAFASLRTNDVFPEKLNGHSPENFLRSDSEQTIHAEQVKFNQKLVVSGDFHLDPTLIPIGGKYLNRAVTLTGNHKIQVPWEFKKRVKMMNLTSTGEDSGLSQLLENGITTYGGTISTSTVFRENTTATKTNVKFINGWDTNQLQLVVEKDETNDFDSLHVQGDVTLNMDPLPANRSEPTTGAPNYVNVTVAGSITSSKINGHIFPEEFVRLDEEERLSGATTFNSVPQFHSIEAQGPINGFPFSAYLPDTAVSKRFTIQGVLTFRGYVNVTRTFMTETLNNENPQEFFDDLVTTSDIASKEAVTLSGSKNFSAINANDTHAAQFEDILSNTKPVTLTGDCVIGALIRKPQAEDINFKNSSSPQPTLGRSRDLTFDSLSVEEMEVEGLVDGVDLSKLMQTAVFHNDTEIVLNGHSSFLLGTQPQLIITGDLSVGTINRHPPESILNTEDQKEDLKRYTFVKGNLTIDGSLHVSDTIGSITPGKVISLFPEEGYSDDDEIRTLVKLSGKPWYIEQAMSIEDFRTENIGDIPAIGKLLEKAVWINKPTVIKGYKRFQGKVIVRKTVSAASINPGTTTSCGSSGDLTDVITDMLLRESTEDQIISQTLRLINPPIIHSMDVQNARVSGALDGISLDNTLLDLVREPQTKLGNLTFLGQVESERLQLTRLNNQPLSEFLTLTKQQHIPHLTLQGSAFVMGDVSSTSFNGITNLPEFASRVWQDTTTRRTVQGTYTFSKSKCLFDDLTVEGNVANIKMGNLVLLNPPRNTPQVLADVFEILELEDQVVVASHSMENQITFYNLYGVKIQEQSPPFTLVPRSLTYIQDEIRKTNYLVVSEDSPADALRVLPVMKVWEVRSNKSNGIDVDLTMRWSSHPAFYKVVRGFNTKESISSEAYLLAVKEDAGVILFHHKGASGFVEKLRIPINGIRDIQISSGRRIHMTLDDRTRIFVYEGVLLGSSVMPSLHCDSRFAGSNLSELIELRAIPHMKQHIDVEDDREKLKTGGATTKALPEEFDSENEVPTKKQVNQKETSAMEVRTTESGEEGTTTTESGEKATTTTES
ncbi:unnamed protein product, partial [Cyprideis torosa]